MKGRVYLQHELAGPVNPGFKRAGGKNIPGIVTCVAFHGNNPVCTVLDA